MSVRIFLWPFRKSTRLLWRGRRRRLSFWLLAGAYTAAALNALFQLIAGEISPPPSGPWPEAPAPKND